MREGPHKGLWIQPAAGNAGGALGAALAVWHQFKNKPRISNGKQDKMKGAYLGPSSSNEEIETFLKSKSAPYVRLADTALFEQVAKDLAEENVVGWSQGRMEFGPRSLAGEAFWVMRAAQKCSPS